jgi:hypothetical protein
MTKVKHMLSQSKLHGAHVHHVLMAGREDLGMGLPQEFAHILPFVLPQLPYWLHQPFAENSAFLLEV